MLANDAETVADVHAAEPLQRYTAYAIHCLRKLTKQSWRPGRANVSTSLGVLTADVARHNVLWLCLVDNWLFDVVNLLDVLVGLGRRHARSVLVPRAFTTKANDRPPRTLCSSQAMCRSAL